MCCFFFEFSSGALILVWFSVFFDVLQVYLCPFHLHFCLVRLVIVTKDLTDCSCTHCPFGRRFISTSRDFEDLTVTSCTCCPFGRRFIFTSCYFEDLTNFCTRCPIGFRATTFLGGYSLCVHCAYETSGKIIAGGSLLEQKIQGSILSHRHMIRGVYLPRLNLSARFHCDCWQIVFRLGLITCLALPHPLGSALGFPSSFVRVFIFRWLYGWAWKMPRFLTYHVFGVFCYIDFTMYLYIYLCCSVVFVFLDTL